MQATRHQRVKRRARDRKGVFVKQKPNTINGICIDENGQPLADVLVQVFSRRIDGSEENTDPILTTKSDSKGEFRFSDVVDIEQEFPEGIPGMNFQPWNAKLLNIDRKSVV